MDCEKFEPLLLDELYEELDELTSAAVKRHVSGCARCGSVLNGLRATRRGISLPLVPVPEGLEDRILAAAREAQKVVPIKSRASRAISWAGSWAMRPQTAMAAVFLLMIGSGAFLIRSRTYESSQAARVSGYGSPAPESAPAAATAAALDNKAADTAHGPGVPPPAIITHPPPAATASAMALADPAAGPMDGITGGFARDKKDSDEKGAVGNLATAAEGRKEEQNRYAPPAKPKAGYAPSTASEPKSSISNAGVPGGTSTGDDFGGSQVVTPNAQSRSRAGPVQHDPFSLGVAAYQARNFAEATKQFDQAAQGGDQNAALWAAKSVREGSGGCPVALGRFDSIAQKAGNTWHGHEASLEAARCQIAMGNHAAARERLAKLQQVSSHAAQAQAALNEMNQQIAARKSAGAAGGSRPAAPRAAAPAPAPPAATPGHHGTGKGAEKKPADLEQHGF
jgi:hypothetical protein